MSKVVSLDGRNVLDPREPNEAAISAAEEILEMARSGEITGFVAVVQVFDNATMTFRSGSYLIDPVLGRLQRLSYVLSVEAENG